MSIANIIRDRYHRSIFSGANDVGLVGTAPHLQTHGWVAQMEFGPQGRKQTRQNYLRTITI